MFHLAADPEVRVGITQPDKHFQQNLVATKSARISEEKGKFGGNCICQPTQSRVS